MAVKKALGALIAATTIVLLCHDLQAGANTFVTITPTTLSGRRFVCPNETINFRCIVLNTLTLTWESNEYIGDSRSITFVVGLNRPGDGIKVDRKATFAQLLDVECNLQHQTQLCNLTSDLEITTPSKPDGSIRCRSDTSSRSSDINITQSVIPDKPQLQTPTLISQNGMNLEYRVEWRQASNWDKFDFDHYRVQFGFGQNFQSVDVIEESTIIAFEMGTASNVSVAVVNKCGQESDFDVKSLPHPASSNNGLIIGLAVFFPLAIVTVVIIGIIAIVLYMFKPWEIVGTIRQTKATVSEEKEQLNPSTENHNETSSFLNCFIRRKGANNNANDLNPKKMAVCDAITEIFKRHGAVALKTPLLEDKNTVKCLYGSQKKELYSLTGKLSLRYDLTVPFVRHLAKEDITEMKRYQIDGVYRLGMDERVIGKNRDFYQCDFDIAGKYDSMVPDAECLQIIAEILSELKFDMKRVSFKVTHWKIMEKLIRDKCGFSDTEFKKICTKVYKHPEQDWIVVCKKSFPQEKFIELKKYMTGSIKLDDLNKSSLMDFAGEEIEEMQTLSEYCKAFGISDRVFFDLNQSFQLNFYTGIKFEAVHGQEQTLLAYGGRYDDMVERIPPGHIKVPCVGFTVKIEEIFKLLNKRDEMNLDSVRKVQTIVLVASDQGCLTERMKLCAGLWKSKIKAEYYYKKDPRLDDQLQYCEESDIPFCVIVRNEGRWIRDIKTGCEEYYTRDDEIVAKLTMKMKERDNWSLFKGE